MSGYMCACVFLRVHMCGGQRLNQMSSSVAFALFTEAGSLAYSSSTPVSPLLSPF